MRRLSTCIIALLTSIYAIPVQAESWPERPIRTIVPFPAGGIADVVARVVMDQIAIQIGRPIVIENRIGAGGTLGAAQVAKAAPDGYTLLVHSVAHTIAPATFSKLSYDPVRDIAAISPLARQRQVLVVAPTAGYQTVKDFVSYASAKRGSLSYASAGVGSGAHFAAERFLKSAGLRATHVPFKGSAEALSAVMMGQVNFLVSPLVTAIPLIKEGKLLALAVPSTQRAGDLPKIPTMLEAGFADTELDIWCGLFAPARTSAAILQRLHREANVALKHTTVLERLAKIGAEPITAASAEFENSIRQEIATNVALARSLGLQPK